MRVPDRLEGVVHFVVLQREGPHGLALLAPDTRYSAGVQRRLATPASPPDRRDVRQVQAIGFVPFLRVQLRLRQDAQLRDSKPLIRG